MLPRGLWPGLAEETCRAGGSLPLTAAMGSGWAGVVLGLGRGGRAGYPYALDAAPGPFRRLTYRWLPTRGMGSAGCPPPASTSGEDRCLGWGAVVVSGQPVKGSRSRSSSWIVRHDTGHRGRCWRAQEKDLIPLLESWWTWAAAAGVVFLVTAAETVAVPGHSARSQERMARDSCGVEPYHPNGHGGQSCDEQSRPLQTFGGRSTDDRQVSLCPSQSLVSLCCLKPAVGLTRAGQPYRMGGDFQQHRHESGSRVLGRARECLTAGHEQAGRSRLGGAAPGRSYLGWIPGPDLQRRLFRCWWN